MPYITLNNQVFFFNAQVDEAQTLFQPDIGLGHLWIKTNPPWTTLQQKINTEVGPHDSFKRFFGGGQ